MNRVQRLAPVVRHEEVAEGIHLLAAECPDIARQVRPGQFVNVRLVEGPAGALLRRPFSVSRVDGDAIEVLFNVVGKATRSMASRRLGDMLDLLGPLGRPFGTDSDFDSAMVVAGGLGVAPLPFLVDDLRGRGKKVQAILGARTARHIVRRHLEDAIIATDDGSEGLKGSVVDLLTHQLDLRTPERLKIFACGPTPMLKALGTMAVKRGIECELSLEGDMACGFGICQGCPVERTNGHRKYALVCTDGPTFHAQDVVL